MDLYDRFTLCAARNCFKDSIDLWLGLSLWRNPIDKRWTARMACEVIDKRECESTFGARFKLRHVAHTHTHTPWGGFLGFFSYPTKNSNGWTLYLTTFTTSVAVCL